MFRQSASLELHTTGGDFLVGLRSDNQPPLACGTLAGIESKLGYLIRLGVTAIWISPTFKQVAVENSYHGYGIQDFLEVDLTSAVANICDGSSQRLTPWESGSSSTSS